MHFHDWPLGIAKDNDRDVSASEILLIPDVLVGAEKKIIAGLFGFEDQVAVRQFMLTDPAGEGDLMA